MMATLPNLTALSDEALVEMVATLSDNDAELELVLTELDRRDIEEQADREPTEEERRQDLLKQSRKPGESLDQLVDRMYGEATELLYLAAEAATNGYMIKKEFAHLGIDPYSLFHGPARAAAKYASRELMDWFRANGRVTWIEYKYAMLGRSSDAAAAARAARATADYIR